MSPTTVVGHHQTRVIQFRESSVTWNKEMSPNKLRSKWSKGKLINMSLFACPCQHRLCQCRPITASACASWLSWRLQLPYYQLMSLTLSAQSRQNYSCQIGLPSPKSEGTLQLKQRKQTLSWRKNTLISRTFLLTVNWNIKIKLPMYGTVVVHPIPLGDTEENNLPKLRIRIDRGLVYLISIYSGCLLRECKRREK